MSSPADVQAAFAAVLVDEWARAGITDAVVCPGSRSTPMLVALADDGRLRLHVVLDERAAGFMALGMGLATGRPAPVVTTSGTAAVELHPAVIEAHQAGVPLLAVTADRPPELHGVGAPQTVVQDGLYGVSVRWQASPGVPDVEAMASWRSLASRSVAATTHDPRGPGPVHLNLAFREPLLGSVTVLPAGREGGAPWHLASVPRSSVSGPARPFAAGTRGIIVAGGGINDPAAVTQLAATMGWPILADPRSGCRAPGAATVVAAADAILRVQELATDPAWRPDVVVRLGRPWASKVLGQWLSGLGSAVTQILVDPFGAWADPDRQVAEVVVADPGGWCRAVIGALDARRPNAATTTTRRKPASSPWRDRWAQVEAKAQGAIDAVLAEPGGALSEPGIARRVIAAMTPGSTLVTSSSMPVRDVEWYGGTRSGVRVVANRGVNGIDGVVSTTIGVAVGSGEPTVGLVGDLTFLYDAGALLWATTREIDCTVVVVDNDGGGIFSFLPRATGLAPAVFTRLWGTPHGLDVGAVAAAYGVPVIAVSSAAELDALVGSTGRSGVRVAVVRTDRDSNVGWHDRLNAAVAVAVEEMAAG